MQFVDEDYPGKKNELLRLSHAIGNESAARILLQPPEVRKLAARHHYYINDKKGKLDLMSLAQELESFEATEQS